MADTDFSQEHNEDGKAKKRTAERQLRSDEDPDDEIESVDSGDFARASDSVLAKRRIVKAKRSRGAEEQQSTTTNAFSAIPTKESAANESTSPKDEKANETNTNGESKEKASEINTNEHSSAKSPSPLPAFSFSNSTNIFGSVSSTPAVSFGTLSTSPSAFSFGSSPSPGFSFIPATSFPTSSPSLLFSIPSSSNADDLPDGNYENESFYIPGQSSKSTPTENVPSGEEHEKHSYQTRAKVFVFENGTWAERGIGTVRINIADDNSYARLLMRQEGTLRIVLNARLFPKMKVELVGDKQLRLIATAIDSSELCTYLIRLPRPEIARELLDAIEKSKTFGTVSAKGQETGITNGKQANSTDRQEISKE